MTVRRWHVVTALAVIAATATGYAQAALGAGAGGNLPANPRYDGRYAFLRLSYLPKPLGGCAGSGEGPGWQHDYPKADRSMMKILGQVTSVDALTDSSVIVPVDSRDLSNYPIAYLSEPGCWEPTDAEAKALRAYLLKGGFLIVDDFNFPRPPRFVAGRENFEAQIKRVLPEGKLVLIKPSDPVFKVFFELKDPQRLFPGFGGSGEKPEFRGIYEDNDPTKRLLVVANYNNDIGDYWEFSGQGFMPVGPTNEAYKVGVNYIMYGFTH